MLMDAEPRTPIDAYKAIIDRLAGEVRLRGPSARVAEHGEFSNAPDHREFNTLIQSLSPSQRELVSRMLQEVRHGAIHDVLAELTWWITAREVGLTFHGDPMPVELSGMGLHGDYVGRVEGWEWPAAKS